MSPLQAQMLQSPSVPSGLPRPGASHRVHFGIAPDKLSGGVNWRIFDPGARLRARFRARCERASAIMFFFPSMWKMRKSMLCSIRILTAASRIGLYRSSARKLLKMENEDVESVWITRRRGSGCRLDAHSKGVIRMYMLYIGRTSEEKGTGMWED